jgi:parallel beta-helix repeat protein
MAHKIQIKRGNKADIPVLNDGEMGLCIDTQEVFVGCNGTNIPVNTNKRTARFVIGTSTAGWTAADCDYLCDGTNDQTEINAAITALPATGGKIVILEGTYNISAKISVNKSNVSIVGNGHTTELRRRYHSSSSEGLINIESGVSQCRIENLFLNGENYTHLNNNGIRMTTGAENIIVSGNKISNHGGSGIYAWPASKSEFTNNILENNGQNGMYIRLSSETIIIGNSCNNNSQNGIYLQDSSNNTITGNSCSGNGDNGISFYASKNNTVTGNIFYNNNSGIFMAGSSRNNAITGNVCIRGTGQASDYTESQHTILLNGTSNGYNLIAMNNCMGKAPVVEGGTGNTLVNNKFDAS